jgi:ABC-2 type transport system permease protein
VNVLSAQINSGNFDNFMLSPVQLYVRILSSYSKVSAFGDILYGIILLTIFAVMTQLSIWNILLLIALIPFCTLIMVNFQLVTGLISFLIPDTAEAAANTFELMITPALYPSGLYSKPMQFVFKYIIPAIIVSGFPIEVVMKPSIGGVFLIVGTAIIWTFLGVFLLKKAVRKYESGNLMGYKG